MKRLILLLVALLSLTLADAQQVSEQEALQKAQQFFANRHKAQLSRGMSPRKAPKLTLANNCNEYYVFNDEANGGYVVVSGDECVPPILGYSETGKINGNMPDNMQAWLQEYAYQIAFLKKESYRARARKAVVGPSISPLLDKTIWGQNEPYNLLCPEHEGQHTITGCVSTAMAQIMHYYQWPKVTTKEIPGYTTETLKLPVSSIPISSIDWENILPTYNSGSESQEQKDAVAKLMLMCGTSLKMDYNMDGSSSSVDDIAFSLKEYFDYASTAKILRYSEYSLDELNQITYKELACGRPTCLGGQNSAGQGHAFVVDGYDKDDFFHINWGWNGENNGYFLLSLVDPNNVGEGYNRYPVCVVGIKRSIDINPDGDNDGDIFIAKTVEGVEMSFEIISVEEKTCEVKGNDSYKPAIDPMTSGTVTVPEEVNGYKVISIGPSAFYECGEIQKVIMPQTITRIGHDAFIYCRKMESAEIPLGVKQIDYQAFHDCNSLTSIVIPNGVTMIPYNAFTGTGITSIVPSGYETDGTSAVIPEGVTQIVGSAFAGCENLESVVLPAGVKEVGGNMACTSFGNPFVGCNSLKSLDVEKGSPYYHAEGNCIIESATNCVSIGCNNSVIPSYAKHIGQGAFCNLNFKEFVVPEGIVSVEKDAFNNSFYLKEVTLPSTITYIDKYAFWACEELKTLKVKMAKPIAIENILDWTGLDTLYVPIGTGKLYRNAEGWKNFKNIEEMAFNDVIEVTANSCTKKYGEDNPVFEYSITGGAADGTPIVSCEATALSPAGTYPIEVKKGNMTNSDVTLTNGTLTITKVPLTISVGAYTKRQGEPLPEFMLNYEGFKNDETNDVLIKQPVVTCETTENSFPGKYPIRVSGAEAQNYDISYVEGVLTIPFDVGNVVKVINFIMGGSTTSDDMAFYDMNKDGELNIGDVILVVKNILDDSGDVQYAAEARGNVKDDLTRYSAVQFVLKTEKGVSIQDIRLVGSMEQSHQLSCRQIDDETYAVVIYSLSNQLLKPDNGNVIVVDTGGAMAEAMTIRNIMAAKPTGEIASFQGLQVVTDVQQIKNDESPAAVYDLNGRRLNGNIEQRNGVYIVNGKKTIAK